MCQFFYNRLDFTLLRNPVQYPRSPQLQICTLVHASELLNHNSEKYNFVNHICVYQRIDNIPKSFTFLSGVESIEAKCCTTICSLVYTEVIIDQLYYKWKNILLPTVCTPQHPTTSHVARAHVQMSAFVRKFSTSRVSLVRR